ncbi:MAG: RNA polymerase sigma factor [Ruminococcus flavefaciens]|nr:RNA polymerase sigma factor [Ruminococcus flavefaciens]
MEYDAFENLVNTMGAEIYSFCLQLTRSRDEADELYQDTMLAAMEKYRKIELPGNPKSFLLGIVIRQWKNKRRKIARRNRICPQTTLDEQIEEVYQAAEGQSLEEEIVRKETIQMVRKMTAQLPDKYQIPVYLYYSRELSIEEIAAAMHIPAGTVKSRLHKARTIIKSSLEGKI